MRVNKLRIPRIINKSANLHIGTGTYTNRSWMKFLVKTLPRSLKAIRLFWVQLVLLKKSNGRVPVRNRCYDTAKFKRNNDMYNKLCLYRSHCVKKEMLTSWSSGDDRTNKVVKFEPQGRGFESSHRRSTSPSRQSSIDHGPVPERCCKLPVHY